MPLESLSTHDIIRVYDQLQSVTRLTDSSVWLAAVQTRSGGREYTQIGAPVRHNRKTVEDAAVLMESFSYEQIKN